MSKNLPETSGSEEVDLGQLFKLIGNAFERLFKFLGGVLNKIFLGFVWVIFFLKKHFLKLLIAAVVGFVFVMVKEKFSKPVYTSSITVKQNYQTGEILFNSIEYYNSLIDQKDTMTLKNVLSKPENVNISSILSIEMEAVVDENGSLKAYNDYILSLDSTIALGVDYETYIGKMEDYSHIHQQISIQSKQSGDIMELFEKIVENVNSNPYFKNEQEKDINQLANSEIALKEGLAKSDSLQKTYKRVLERTPENEAGSQTSITIKNKDDINETKEFDLYKSDMDLRREIVSIIRQKQNKAKILEIVSNKQNTGIVDNSSEVLGVKISNKIIVGFFLAFLTFLVLASLEFIKFLEKYK